MVYSTPVYIFTILFCNLWFTVPQYRNLLYFKQLYCLSWFIVVLQYEVKFEIPERILFMALESVLYDEEQV